MGCGACREATHSEFGERAVHPEESASQVHRSSLEGSSKMSVSLLDKINLGAFGGKNRKLRNHVEQQNLEEEDTEIHVVTGYPAARIEQIQWWIEEVEACRGEAERLPSTPQLIADIPDDFSVDASSLSSLTERRENPLLAEHLAKDWSTGSNPLTFSIMASQSTLSEQGIQREGSTGHPVRTTTPLSRGFQGRSGSDDGRAGRPRVRASAAPGSEQLASPQNVHVTAHSPQVDQFTSRSLPHTPQSGRPCTSGSGSVKQRQRSDLWDEEEGGALEFAMERLGPPS
eukprot:Hpha_TRINITY_DN11358_c0_g1::TRINITY_DN11358_c0_g1_i1::g.62960::m.62960